MNTTIKANYLDDFTNSLQAHDKKTSKYNRFSGDPAERGSVNSLKATREAREKNKEMQKQTTDVLLKTINKIQNIEEYQVV